ncbi:hypothetical protein GcC1_184037 [Golovinomyces cichoracearum]|uniref:G3BP-like protein n=1 Tax=Golovinomyces cichoracearum TaxID=62708 RepID=A0A420HLC1_9PEZI|nr:hypothetical protein GcC1_184037 [Golovinomyces cichoracearum]
MTTNGSFTHQEQFKPENELYAAVSNPTETKIESSVKNNLNKDEVGWYFVEQFYITMSREPNRLHLFYGNNSQFVYGLEAQVSAVSVGRDAIQERIKKLKFQDTKVRVSNVDTQSSYDCIVIQVIGEISHLSMEPKKFVQTFILAQQRNGYFVLNDIFRYIIEDVAEEEPNETLADESVPSASPLVDARDPNEESKIQEQISSPPDNERVETKSEEATVSKEPSMEESIEPNGIPTNEPLVTQIETPIIEAPEKELKPEQIEPTAEEDPKSMEKSEETSSPSEPIRSPIDSKPLAPVQSSGPPKPLSWASRAAAAVGSTPKPAIPIFAPKSSNQPNRTDSSASKSVSSSNITSNFQNENEKEKEKGKVSEKEKEKGSEKGIEKEKGNASHGSGWQTAGENLKKQSRPQSISGPPDKPCTQVYVRNVTDKVETGALRALLSSFGPLHYFDINRFKNCAFVEFETIEAYQAATNASPHQLSGESIFVEPRRPKTNAYGGNGYSGGRPGTNQRSRGSFANRVRGSGTPRGRGQPGNA